MNDFLKNFESIAIPNDIHREAVAGLGEAARTLRIVPEGAAREKAEAALLAAKEAVTEALGEIVEIDQFSPIWT